MVQVLGDFPCSCREIVLIGFFLLFWKGRRVDGTIVEGLFVVGVVVGCMPLVVV